MFEVDWTDYDRELVGERKARKEIQKDRKRKEDLRSGRASISTRSSSSSSDKPLGFFGSIGLRKRQNSSKNKKGLSFAILQTLKDGGKATRDLGLIPEIPFDTSISSGMTSNGSESQAPSSLGALEETQRPGGFENAWESQEDPSMRGVSYIHRVSYFYPFPFLADGDSSYL